MVLDHFQIGHGRTLAEQGGRRSAVGEQGAGVVAEQASRPAAAEDEALRRDTLRLAAADPPEHPAAAAPVAQGRTDQTQVFPHLYAAFAFQLAALAGESRHQLTADAGVGVGGSLLFLSAEAALIHPSFLVPAEHGAQPIGPADDLRRGGRQARHRLRVGQIAAGAECVGQMLGGRIVLPFLIQGRVDAALRHHGLAAFRLIGADKKDPGLRFGAGDGGGKAGQTVAHDKDVVHSLNLTGNTCSKRRALSGRRGGRRCAAPFASA